MASATNICGYTIPQECFDNINKPMTRAEPTSFCLGFFYSTIFSGNPITGVIGGALNVLASRIDSFIKPILRDKFDAYINDHARFFPNHAKFALKSFTVLSICNLLSFAVSPLLGFTMRINLLTSMIIKHIFYIGLGSNPNVWGHDSNSQIYGSKVSIT